MVRFPFNLAVTHDNRVGSWTYDRDALVSCVMGRVGINKLCADLLRH